MKHATRTHTARRAAAIAGAILTLLLAGAAGDDYAARVLRVMDGDTLRVATATAQYTIRLRTVDAPELAQPYGPAAAAAAAALCQNKDLTIRPNNQDPYGRTVATVILPDESTLQDHLLDAGLAWWYRAYEPRDRNAKARQNAARAARVGLWQDPFPTPPWTFRAIRRAAAAPRRHTTNPPTSPARPPADATP
jgi:endonuclease YncB( thermonuclease family)